MEKFFGIKPLAPQKQQGPKNSQKKQKKEVVIADIYGKLKSFSPKAHSEKAKAATTVKKLQMTGYNQHKWIDKIRYLQQQLDILANKYFIEQSKSNEYLKRCKQLKKLSQRLSQQNKKLRKGGFQLSEFNLKQKYEQERAASSKLAEEVRSLKNQYTARLKVEKEQYQRDIRDIKKNYQHLLNLQKEGLDTLRKEYSGYQQAIKGYQNKIKSLTLQNQHIKKTQQHNQHELRNYQTKCNKYEIQLEQRKSNGRRNQNNYHSKAANLNRSNSGDEWNSKNSNWNHQSKDSPDKYKHIKAEHERLLISEKILKRQNENLKEQVRLLQIECQNLKYGQQTSLGFVMQKSLDLQKELLQLQKCKRTSSNKKQKELIEFCCQKQRVIIELTQQAKNFNIKLQLSEQKMNQAFSKIDYYSKENTRLNQQVFRLQKQMYQLSERANQAVLFSAQSHSREIKKKSKNIQNLNSNRRLRARNSRNDIDQEINLLKQQNYRLENQNALLRKQLQEKQTENRILKLDLRKLEHLQKQREPPLPHKLITENGRHRNINSARNLLIDSYYGN